MRLDDKCVFLSGPVTGRKRSEYERAFRHAEEVCQAAGAFRVYNPVRDDMNRPSDSHETCMLNCIHELTSRQGIVMPDGRHAVRHYDVMVQLPGWAKSCGCQDEARVAKAVGIPVISLCEVDAARRRQEDETCHNEGGSCELFVCSECGCSFPLLDQRRMATLHDGSGMGLDDPDFCPCCGRRVVDEEVG